MSISKRDLTAILSRLKNFEMPSVQLEQYATPPEIAADWVWHMALQGEVAGKVILDAACGPGILGIGLLLLGAKKVFFLDKSASAIEICRENYENLKKEYELGKAEFVMQDVVLFDEAVDVVVQNPLLVQKLNMRIRNF